MPYLFIAYKSDSDDYCRGCRMASYSADHIVENFLSKDRLIEIWATYLYKNLNLDCNESGYDFWIFKDGVMIFKENYTYWDGYEKYGYNTDEYYTNLVSLEGQEQIDQQDICVIEEEAKKLAQTKQQEQLKAKHEQAKELAAKKESEEKQKRKKQFELLAKEFA